MTGEADKALSKTSPALLQTYKPEICAQHEKSHRSCVYNVGANTKNEHNPCCFTLKLEYNEIKTHGNICYFGFGGSLVQSGCLVLHKWGRERTFKTWKHYFLYIDVIKQF